MRTVVFQSHKTINQPNWLKFCIESVKKWAYLKAYSYVFVGDELFDVLPPGVRQNFLNNIWPATDVARVIYADKLLTSGKYGRAIWIDADVFICNIEDFFIDPLPELVLCREIWVSTDFKSKYNLIKKVNNCIISIRQGSSFLKDYPQKALSIMEQSQLSGSPLLVGTDVFTNAEKKRIVHVRTDRQRNVY